MLSYKSNDEEGLEVLLLRQLGEVKTGLRKSNW